MAGALYGGLDKAKASSAPSESEDAAQDVLDAISDGDAGALDLALKRHYELCASEPDGDEDEEG